MKTILRNWKTSLLGSGAISTAIVQYAQNPNDLKTPLVMAVIGLLGLFAKDGNVTGN